ncbi:hypothetical protein [Halorussus pelagicus]|uniref:hypothetical protein n=1 Tax=Halorussus pelagicus TaxID=2505977 RepID=UPI000FFBAE55|nr:hypothetical protein [Halorussus pelagicus]
MGTVQEAARDLVELEALKLSLKSRRSECIGAIKGVRSADETVYFLNADQTKHLRIFEAQWEVYAYVNTIHALWEFAKTCEPFLPKSQFAPVNTVPELLAVRNCMQHNGPVQINYEKNRNDIVVPVERLKKRGDWGGRHTPFERYFPNWSKGDLVHLRTFIEASNIAYNSIVDKIEDEYKETHSANQLEEAANDLSLYE